VFAIKEDDVKQFLVMIVIMLSNGVRAEKISSTIHSINLGERGEPHLIRFDNSRVSFIASEETELLKSFLIQIKHQREVEVDIDKNNNIISAESKSFPTDPPRGEDGEVIQEPIPLPTPFNSTVVKGSDAAKAIFKKMRRDYTKGGECFNRAHIWTYEDHLKSGRNLMKVFMFFTDRYIRRYKYHWWFHVSPMVYQANKSSPRILDRRYTSGPRTTKIWSDIFIKSKRTCKKVKTFDEYFEHQERADCYHIHTSMYYYVPRDIEKRDLTGIEKSEFNENEIKRAYQNAFKQGTRF
jgi:hypothetical protein